MNDEILTINDYPIGWGWLKDVPLQDWEWLIDVFATMTDNTDTYSYITYAEEDGAKLTDVTYVKTVGLAKFLYEDPTKAKQEIVDQVNNIYGNEKLTFFSLQGIQEYFETIHLECQEISFNQGGTVIQKQGIPEL